MQNSADTFGYILWLVTGVQRGSVSFECISVNFGPGDSGEHVCEFSDSNHSLLPGDIKSRIGFIYKPTYVGTIQIHVNTFRLSLVPVKWHIRGEIT